MSFNNAKRLYSEGNPLKPTFDEFMQVLCQYGELEFTYNGDVYGVIRGESKTGGEIELFCDNKPDSLKLYHMYDDFRERANIDGLLLKDIWRVVEKINILQQRTIRRF